VDEDNDFLAVEDSGTFHELQPLIDSYG